MYERTIIKQFENIAHRFGNKVAIKDNSDLITYSNLNKSVKNISRKLYKKNDEIEYVYLFFQQGITMIIGMLSALKSGKAYIPLDPKQPLERLNYIIQDTKGYIILTDSKNLDIANKLKIINNSIEVINIDFIKESTISTIQDIGDKPEQIAYILYTSGSTGKPKGVIQNNKNVMYHVNEYSKNLNITEQDNITLFSKYTFDASVMDIYSALLNGATLFIFDTDNIELFVNFEKWIFDNKITIYHSVPTIFRHIVRKVKNYKYLETIRAVVLGGESVLINDFEQYQKIFSDKCIFVNGLGPTEATVALQFIADKSTKINSLVVPIGYPIEGTTAYVVDDKYECIKGSDIGELILRSEHLAIGYYGMKDETEKHFKIDLNGKGRFYLTGDMVRRGEAGIYEFCGRKDSQIKINGIRIELNEIESVLDKYIKIKKSIVVLIEMGEIKIIVAYYTTKQEYNNIKDADLIRWLKTYLPDYMIPSSFYYIDTLPLTETGKIDRKKIVEHYKTYNQHIESIDHLDEIENKIFLVWKKLLQNSSFDLDTTFKSAGGDSLILVELEIEIEDIYGISIGLVELSKLDTVRKLANYIKGELL